jgi:hypothetical protein
MARRRIRLRYTGLVAYATRVISIFTGLVFIVTVTRSIPTDEFGVWQYISLLTSYIVFPLRGINYWATRDIARDIRRSARTCLLLNMAIALVGMTLFLAVSGTGAAFLRTDISYFFISSMTVLEIAAIRGLEAVAYGAKPQAIAHSFLGFEVSKVTFGLVTVFLWDWGLQGALLSIFFAYLIQSAMLGYALRGTLQARFDASLAIRWIKRMWLPILSSFTAVLSSLDVTVLTVLTGSTEPIALLKAAQVITTTIGYSSFMASALYPKLLTGGSVRDIETALDMVLLAALPMTVGAIALAEPLLRVLQQQYSIAAPILKVAAISTVANCLQSVMNNIITGTERIDEKQELAFADVLKSRLFLPAKITYLFKAIYLVGVYVAVNYYASTGTGDLIMRVVWVTAIFELATTLPSVAVKWYYAAKIRKFRLPLGSVLRKGVATTVMVAVLLLFYPRRALETLLAVFVGFAAYAVTILALDAGIRAMVLAGIEEAKRKFGTV